MTLREPPLVEMATATSPASAWAMSWRRKTTSEPTSLAMAVTVAGSRDERHRRDRPQSRRRSDAVDRPVVGVGGRAAVAEDDELAAALQPVAHRQRGLADPLGLLAGHLSAERRVVRHLHEDRATPPGSRGRPVPASRARGMDRGSPTGPTSWPSSRCSKKTCTVSQSVWYRTSISSWWTNGSAAARRDGVRRPRCPGARRSSRPASRRAPSAARTACVSLGRTEAHHHVVGADQRLEPGAEQRAQVERGQRPLARRSPGARTPPRHAARRWRTARGRRRAAGRRGGTARTFRGRPPASRRRLSSEEPLEEGVPAQRRRSSILVARWRDD